jgi:hypothetical protein
MNTLGEAVTSRVKVGTENERILQAACVKASSEGRPFRMVAGYDNDKIGAYVDFTIWYPVAGVRP